MLFFHVKSHAADFLTGAGVGAFVTAHIAVIDQYIQACAGLLTIVTLAISIYARFHASKKDKPKADE